MEKRKIVFLILIVFLGLFALKFDEELIKEVSLLRNSLLDEFFIVITFISSEIIIFFILTALFLWREHKRRWIFLLWVSLGISAVLGFILKVSFQRLRPFQIGIVELLPKLQESSFSLWNFSFPSFQSMLAFCAIPLLDEQFPKLKKFWISFALLIAFSRIYFGVHFVSDVIFGGVIGYLIGTIVVKLEKENSFGKKIYEKVFKR